LPIDEEGKPYLRKFKHILVETETVKEIKTASGIKKQVTKKLEPKWVEWFDYNLEANGWHKQIEVNQVIEFTYRNQQLPTRIERVLILRTWRIDANKLKPCPIHENKHLYVRRQGNHVVTRCFACDMTDILALNEKRRGIEIIDEKTITVREFIELLKQDKVIVEQNLLLKLKTKNWQFPR